MRWFDAMSRRQVLRALGLTVLGACTSTHTNAADAASSDAKSSTDAPDPCAHVTETTRGPYFADDRADPNIANDTVDAAIPERSDLRADTEGAAGVQPGVPLVLTITVGSDRTCTPLAGAQVHVWHCNAQGVYSDFTAPTNDGGVDHTHQDFLRGYQITDAGGTVTFTTIYPGWYSGRAVHIHVKVRVFDAAGTVTTESTTQLFLDDNVSDAVYAQSAPYAKPGTRLETAMDSIYQSERPSLFVRLTGDVSNGFAGNVALAVAPGTIDGG